LPTATTSTVSGGRQFRSPLCAMGQSVGSTQAHCAQQHCGCLPTGSLSALAAECRGDFSTRRHVEEIGVSIDNFETDGSSSEGSEGSDSPAKLTLARHRLFSSHLRAKFHDHYRIEKMLGEGSYGNVFEAIAHSSADVGSSLPAEASDGSALAEQPRRVAAKCFQLSSSSSARQGETEAHLAARRVKETSTRRASFEKERAILARLEHPHIIRIFEVFEEAEHLWIVMELCRGGELYESIADRVRRGTGAGVEEVIARVLYRQMVHAMSYLQSCRIVHRDVKTENFLLLGPQGSPDAEVVKLCDFGTAMRLSDDYPRAMERIGTLSYTAPEIYAKLGCSTLADVWSLGVVLYVLLVGASPFRITGEEPRQDTIDRISHGRFDTERPAWQWLSEQAKDLIRRFLVVHEAGRLKYGEALRHPWLEQVPADIKRVPERASSRALSRRFVSPRARHEVSLVDLVRHAPGALSLLSRFASLDAFQQLVLTVCAQMTSEAELMRLSPSIPWYDLFFALDSDEDGKLDLHEFVEGMKALLESKGDVPEDQLVDLASSLDLDGSGAIDWAEWVAVPLVCSETFGLQVEPLATAFRVLDRPSGDGSIGVADLLAVATTGADDDTSSNQARDTVCRMLARWSCAAPTGPGLARSGEGATAALAVPALSASRLSQPRRSKRRSRGGQATPSLSAAEVRRVLTSASMDSNEWQLDSWAQSTSWFACCQTEGPTAVNAKVCMSSMSRLEHQSSLRSNGSG